MATYAVIKDGIVINTIVGESKEEVESIIGLTCIEYVSDPSAANLDPNIGDAWDGNVFTKPSIS